MTMKKIDKKAGKHGDKHKGKHDDKDHVELDAPTLLAPPPQEDTDMSQWIDWAGRANFTNASGSIDLDLQNWSLQFEEDTPRGDVEKNPYAINAYFDGGVTQQGFSFTPYAYLGSIYSDRMVGNEYFNEFHGQWGNDFLYGNGGVDWLYGGDDNDSLDGGADNDLLVGGRQRCHGRRHG
jgi:Ca2+-binding RTX toxin-like protein